MDEPIEIKIDNKELNHVLDKLFEKTSDLKPLMKNIAGIMADSVEENFKQEGQPDKWEELKKVRTTYASWCRYFCGLLFPKNYDILKM